MWSETFGVDFWWLSFRIWGITELPSIKGSLSWSLVSFQGAFLSIKLIFGPPLHCQTWLLLERRSAPAGAIAQRPPRQSCPAWWPCKPFSAWACRGPQVSLRSHLFLSNPALLFWRLPGPGSINTLGHSCFPPRQRLTGGAFREGTRVLDFSCVRASWPLDLLPRLLLVLHIEAHLGLESSSERQ